MTTDPAFAAIRVRTASLADYDAPVALSDELDEIHRRARPDFFQPFDGPARPAHRAAPARLQPRRQALL